MTDYERIGTGYAMQRRADPRIAAAINAALGHAPRVLNVGAGTGNYEPVGPSLVALEPSPTMLAQRDPHAAPAVRGIAEALPFPSRSFDAALCVLTVHHWRDRAGGLRELQRVAPRQVVFFFEPARTDEAWMMDYWPEIRDLPSEIDPPGEAFFRRHLAVRDVVIVPVPNDCTDGFGGAYWSRPEAYLDAGVRSGMSSFAQLAPSLVAAGAERLRADLASGRWDARHGRLRTLATHDVGYRIVIAGD